MARSSLRNRSKSGLVVIGALNLSGFKQSNELKSTVVRIIIRGGGAALFHAPKPVARCHVCEGGMNQDKADVGIFQVPVAASWTSDKHLVEPVAPRGPPHPSWSTSTTAFNPIKVRMWKQSALEGKRLVSSTRKRSKKKVYTGTLFGFLYVRINMQVVGRLGSVRHMGYPF